jgi:GTP-binding protein HflX
MAEDLLFATLDPTIRAIGLPGVEKAILSDTVGFISDLPTQLVAAFRATLEEVTEADVILHVRDIANPDSSAQKRQVLEVLEELGVIEGEGGETRVPMLELWNKWDLLSGERREELAALAEQDVDVLPISAETGFGVAEMLDRVGRLLTEGARVHRITVAASDGARIAWLHAHGEVLDEQEAGEGETGPLRRLDVRLTDKEFGRYAALDA